MCKKQVALSYLWAHELEACTRGPLRGTTWAGVRELAVRPLCVLWDIPRGA